MGSDRVKKLHDELERLKQENQLLREALERNIPVASEELSNKGTDSSDDNKFSFGEIQNISFDGSRVLMWSKDLHGKYRFSNSEFAAIHGLTPSQVKGKTDFEIYPKVYAEKLIADDIKVINTGKPLIIEEILPSGKGMIWFEIIKVPLIENSRIIGLTAIAKDISTQKKYRRSVKESGQIYKVLSVAAVVSEVKYLEGNLRNSKSQVQAIMDNIPHLAWLKSAEGKYISVNTSFANYHNLQLDDIIGKTDMELFPESMAQDHRKKDQKVLNSGESQQFFEVDNRKADSYFSETFLAPVFTDENKVIGITGISRDLTGEKQTEKALKSSEQKFRDFVTLLPEIVFETDEEGNLTFFNLKAYEKLGYTQTDLMKGLNLLDLVAKYDTQRIREIFKSFKFGSELRGKEFDALTSSGKEFPVLIFTSNIYTDNSWKGIRGVMVDISKRKQAEEQERLYQSKLLYLSDAALEFLGMDRKENLYRFIGTRLADILEDVSIVVSRFDESKNELVMEYDSLSDENRENMRIGLNLPSGGFSYKIEDHQIDHFVVNSDHLFEFKGGFSESTFGKIPREVSDNLMKKLKVRALYGMSIMRERKLLGSVLILSYAPKLRDKHFIEAFIYQSSIAIHRRQLENELIEAKKMAEESDKLKTAFLANMSHEIRTPLNGILGLTDILVRNKPNKHKARSYLKMIGANGRILLNIVNDIIDISKIETRQIDVLETDLSVEDLLEDVNCIALAEKMILEKEDIELSFTIDIPEKYRNVKADKSKVEQVLINLIGNALKFTRNGRVEFGCKMKDTNTLLFYVKDTGIGIPENKIDKIFDRFTQVDQSMSRSYQGSGLGLAISRGFVDLMGGDIWLKSEVGKGSEFYFTVPVKSSSGLPARKRRRKAEVSDYKWKGLNILIVEDNIVSYKLLEISLTKTGCNILHAENGKIAISMVEEHPEIDIVLMDIQLPVINGYVATEKIKKINPGLPVIAQTANALDSDRFKCLKAGCSDYVTKPIVIDELLPIIDDLVNAES